MTHRSKQQSQLDKVFCRKPDQIQWIYTFKIGLQVNCINTVLYKLIIFRMEQKKVSNILRQNARNILEKDPKYYLPSRYQVEMYQPKSPKFVFQQLQELSKASINHKSKPFIIPKDQQPARPIKKQARDFGQFTDIFVKPKQNLFNKAKYQNQTSLSLQIQAVSKSELSQYVNKALALSNKNPLPQPRGIYEQLIKVQPPNLPNSSIASTLTPGNGYAPSIPPIQLVKQTKNYMRDLLLRCQNGGNSQDAQKQSHLSFFLAVAYQKSQQYQLANKFFYRFMGYAKIMEDKIGMALGANRIGCNQYYLGNYQKSILFHQQNIRLSDSDNVFAGMYNLGIVNRKIQNYCESIDFFQSCLLWTSERNIIDETCLIYGQLGTTYLKMTMFKEAFAHFEKCYQTSKRSNKRIYLDSLLTIIKLSINHNIHSKQNHEDLLMMSLNVAEQLNLHEIAQLCLCNLGILQAKRQFSNNLPTISQICVIQ